MSNTNGDWPASVPAIAKGASRTTNLLIFNDASMATKSITMTAPTSGTKCYLVLRAQKNETTLFEETDESFTLQ